MAKLLQTENLGDLYLIEIKRRLGAMDKQKPADLKTSANDAALGPMREMLGLGKRAKLRVSGIRDYHAYAVLNGVKLELTNSDTRELRKHADVAAAVKAEDAHTEQKSVWCQQRLRLVNAMNSTPINAFKSYARARFGSIEATTKLAPGRFCAVVTDFLETRDEKVCNV